MYFRLMPDRHKAHFLDEAKDPTTGREIGVLTRPLSRFRREIDLEVVAPVAR